MSYYSNKKNKKTGCSRLTKKLITHTHTVYNEHHLFAGVYHKHCEYFHHYFNQITAHVVASETREKTKLKRNHRCEPV